MSSPAGRRLFRKEDHQAIYDVPWGKTKTDPKYPFKVMGEMKIIPAKEYFNRPPFEGPGTSPPSSDAVARPRLPRGPLQRDVHLAGGERLTLIFGVLGC